MPNGNLTYKRGEIRWVRLDATISAEAQKTLSSLIVQNDIINRHGLLTIIVPLRPGSKQAPYAVNIKTSSTNGLDRDGRSAPPRADRFLDVGQIRSVDGQRILGLVGKLEDKYWSSIQTALNIVFGFAF